MSTTRDMDEGQPLVAPDKLYAHHRQQLSAMLDGALSPDAARFMLRRLQHDTDLAACWERWQVCGDVLRGQRHALLPADLARRVAAGIAGDPAMHATHAVDPQRRPRWARWGGGAALAASVAVAALFVARNGTLGDAPGQASPATQVIAAAPTQAPQPEPPAVSGTEADPSPATVASAPFAVAVAEGTRRAAARRARAQAQRAAVRSAVPRAVAASATPGAVTYAAAMESGTVTRPAVMADPFTGQPLAPVRPWPRAIVPGYSAAGFSVDYGAASSIIAAADAPSFHPFEPQLAGQLRSADIQPDSAAPGALPPQQP